MAFVPSDSHDSATPRQNPITVGPPPGAGLFGTPVAGQAAPPFQQGWQVAPAAAPPPPQMYAPAPPPAYAPAPPQLALEQEIPTPIPMKIVVSGGFGVGKTTFVSAISDIPPLTTEAAMTSVAAGLDNRGEVMTKVTTTVAMDFGRVAVDRSLVLYLFGTPGQDRFGFMWDDLVTGALGAVVLADSRRLNDCFAALDYFESRHIPFVVAVNQFDGRLAHHLDDVRVALALDPGVPVIAVDARHRDSVKWTILSLLDLLLNRAMDQRRP